MSERALAWAYLSRCIEGPSRPLQKLLADGRSPEAIAQGIKRREPWIGELLRTTEARYQLDHAEKDVADIGSLGGRLVTPDDDEWPHETFDQSFGFANLSVGESAKANQEDAVPPHALWVRGKSLRDLCARAVTVVGTRAASSYGKEATRLLVAGLAAHQWTIVSGGALGIDAVAHQTALDSGGSTIMVAACGLDRKYPAAHGPLFESIAQQGTLVSEYPPGITPARHRFLTRNRLAASLGQGTVIVEAAWRSGALNTLTWAESLGRVTMAVPGPITSPGSLGCHDRIRNQRAQLVVSADEVRQLLSAIGQVDVDGQYEMSFARTAVQALSRNEMRVYDALSNAPKSPGEIAAAAGLSMKLTVHLLVELVKSGLAERQGATFLRAENNGE